MSLLRLLAAGSSLMGIRDRPSPYKMTQQNLLPRFGQEKPGEIGPVTAPDAPPTPEAVPDRPKPGGRTTLPAWRVARDSQPREYPTPTAEAPVSEPVERAQAHVAESITQKDGPLAAKAKRTDEGGDEGGRQRCVPSVGKAKRTVGLFQRLGLMKNPFQPKAAARKTVEPVQGELRLEAVRVVRNDLSETDLEIVPADKAADEIVAAPPVNPEVSRLAWRRVAARLFGAGRT